MEAKVVSCPHDEVGRVATFGRVAWYCCLKCGQAVKPVLVATDPALADRFILSELGIGEEAKRG